MHSQKEGKKVRKSALLVGFKLTTSCFSGKITTAIIMGELQTDDRQRR
jgi:hypothetical protein